MSNENDLWEPVSVVVYSFTCSSTNNCIEKTDRKTQETYELIKQQK